MTHCGSLAFTVLADAAASESGYFHFVLFYLALGLLLFVPLLLLWTVRAMKRALAQNRTIISMAETQVELQREQTELQKRTNVLLE
jgi:hypothetical protein